MARYPNSRSVDPMTSSPRNRSLADDLRHRDESALASLLLDRVDLTSPTPESIRDVAARAATPGSVRMALHRLDRRALAVAWAVAHLGTADPEALVAELAGNDAEDSQTADAQWASVVAHGLAELHRLGLVWRDGETLRAVRALSEVVPSVAPDPRPVDPQAVAVQTGAELAAETVNRFAGQQGLAAVQTVRELLRGLEAEPLGLTREGAVAIRELSVRAGQLGLPESSTAMWIELGWLAGLLGPAADSSVILPTLAGEVWRTAPAPHAWAVLVQAWWASDRDWAAFDRPGGVRPYVFGDSHVSTSLPALRREWAELALDAGWAPVRNPFAVLCDRRPLADPARLSQLIDATVAQSEQLGITGRGVLSQMGRALWFDAAPLDPADPEPEIAVVDVATPMLPEEIERIVVQGDHTIVAPGPLTPMLAAQISSFAAVESTGGATVYRLSVSTIEEALDRGWTAEQILEVLKTRSQVEIPQPVGYLIQDTAARHGRIRVGAATGYVRTEDAAALDLVLTALDKAGLAAERLSPTVAVSSVPPATLVKAIRSAGVAATAGQSIDGGTIETGPAVAPVPRPPAPVAGVDPHRVKSLAAALTAIASPDQDVEVPTAPDVPRMHSAQVQAAIASSLTAKDSRMWLRYADNAGADTLYFVKPLHLAGGVCEAFDINRAKPRRFAVSRVIGVVPA